VITGGGRGEQTIEKPDWGHGAFTYKLLDELRGRAREPGTVFTAQQLFASLQRSVTNLTGGKQNPQLADRDTEGQFLFIVPGAGTPAAPTPVIPPATPGGTVEAVDTTARLQITSEPPGAKVYVDDAEKGVTPCTLSIELGVQKTKAVELGLQLIGYKDAVRAVTLERGKLTPVSVTLEKIPVPVIPAPPQLGAARVNPKDGAAMVYVPAGEFLMGSTDADKNAYDDEKPQHRVYLDGYWIYQTEVTVAQYRKFCQAMGRQMPPEPEWKWQDAHPIVNVTWDDAAAYAAWAGAALPTEAQWEKAARGSDGRIYPWGKEWDGAKCVNSVGGNAPGGTKPVGGMPAGVSPYGCLDMAGNVWEWCADWDDDMYYRNAPSRNPTGPATGTMRLLRGGSWRHPYPDFFRAADRDGSSPGDRGDYGGFRCVLRSPGQ
jgi:formylglycine-generating enzyme required for sulfatase activity